MSVSAHNYLSDAWNRDKVMAIVQFLPMMLEGPVQNTGCDGLSKSLGNLSKMADAYRAVTRLSLLIKAVAPGTLEDLSKPKGDSLVWCIDQLSHAAHIGFCLSENTAVLAGHGVLQKELSRLGGLAVCCWLSTLLLGLARQTYLLIKHNPNKKQTERDVVPYTCEEAKHAVVNLVKIGCFTIFALTCLPKGKPQLLCDVSGPLVPLHKLIETLAPNPLQLSGSVRGLLAFVASVCDFY